MKLDSLVELLACVPLFQELTQEQLTRLAFEGEKVLIHSERPIISKDQAGDAAYLIVDGKALRVSGPGIEGQPEILEPGTFIGEMAMLIEASYGSSIIAYGEVKALRFTNKLMHELMQDDVSLAEHFSEHIRGKFMSFTSQLKSLENQLFESEQKAAFASEQNYLSRANSLIGLSQSLQ